jgi:glyoxylase-like metal-dependent hydrolase (beta-lactamase superfamily II)
MLEGNCFVVKCGEGGQGVVIDPGDEGGRIAEEIKAAGVEPEVVLLTHGHIDHTNAAASLRKRFRCRVACHSLDAPMVRGEEGGSLFGFVRTPCAVDQELADGDRVSVGGVEFRVLHTPGHTRGSVCFKTDGVLFSGDTLFRCSIGRTDLPGGSDREMAESLSKVITALDDRTVVHTGHGPSTTIGHEKRHNPFLGAGW